jgi:hypothetical protein
VALSELIHFGGNAARARPASSILGFPQTQQEIPMRKLLLTAVSLAAMLAVGVAQAQSANPTGPSNSNSNKAGEAYPNDPNAANPNKPKLGVVQKAQDSRPAQATKRVTKKAVNATKKGAKKTGDAIRNTGEKIGEKVPPGPNDAKK